MLDISFAELLLVVAVALIFIGPKELPVVIRALVKAVRALKGFSRDIKKTFDDLAKESGLKDEMEAVDHEIKMIQGDDGKWYESYPVPPPVGGRSGGGHLRHNVQNSEQASPHPNPPPAGEGV